MFGTNSIARKDHGAGDHLHVVRGSPFLTIQGEGPYAGHPAVFIRLHGCHLRCVFCDTDFDNPNDPQVSLVDLRNDVLKTRGRARLAVITGGEPMRQNILPLCRELKLCGFKVQIETAGTFWLEGIEEFAEIVCSPKTPTIHPMIYEYAAAFKYIINMGSGGFGGGDMGFVPIVATQPDARPARLATPREGAPVYLSPMDVQDEQRNKVNRMLVARMAIEFGVIAGVQLHKMMDLE